VKRQKSNVRILLVLLMGLFAGAQSVSYGQEDPWKFFDFWGSKSNTQGITLPVIVAFSDTVWSGGARFIGTSVDTANNTAGTKEWMNIGPMHRMGTTGNYVYCEFYIDGTASNITYWNIRFWRRNDPTSNTDLSMRLIDSTGNKASSLVNGYNRIYFTTPIALQEQDYYSVQAVFGTTNVIAFTTNNQNANNPNPEFITDTCKIQTYFETNVTNKVWHTDTNYAQVRAFPIRFYSAGAPQFIMAGNSMYEGNYHYYNPQYVGTTIRSNFSMIGYNSTLGKTYYPGWDVTQTVGYKVAQHFGYTYQNRGRGGWTSTSIRTNFDSNVVKQKPRFVLCDAGLNDAVGQSATTITQMKSMIYKCTSNNIPVIFLAITPTNFHARSQAQVLSYDTVNRAMNTWVTQQQTDSARWWVQWLDLNQYLGVQRDTGTPALRTPNYWDIKSEYTDDGLHFNGAGAELVAQKNIALIQSMFDTVQVNIQDRTVIASPIVSMPINLKASIKALWGVDSVSMTYSINGSATQYSNKLTLDSGNQFSGTYVKSWLPNSGVLVDGDVVSYTLKAHEKGGVRTSTASKTFTIDSLAPMPVLTGLISWYSSLSVNSSPVTFWQNCIDTSTFRQATSTKQPTTNGGVLFDTTDMLQRSIVWYNDSLTMDFLVKITDTNAYARQYVWGWRVNSPYIQIAAFGIGINSISGINKLATSFYNGVGYTHKYYRTSEVTGWYNTLSRFTILTDTTNKQDLYIENTKLLLSSAPQSLTVTDAGTFRFGDAEASGGFKNGILKIFLMYSRKLTAAEMLTNQVFFNYYK